MISNGFVSLVGAGPGDPDHLTLKAARRLREADVVLHDALVSDAVRALAVNALQINVGKRARGEQTPQCEIERLLIDSAQQGLRVVRLKGGDPFVFGRGGEEALALQGAGIAFEIVPGVSSAIGAPALAGIPVTHRGVAPGFLVINGADLDVTDRVLASVVPGLLTVVMLMAIGRRAQIARRLLERGWHPSTPAAVILGAATPAMHTWRGSLGDLQAVTLPEASAAGTIVFGDVAALPIELINGMQVSQEIAR